ncbi:MAG: metalloregulator ArsR/SmtB family transcription factor [Nannocystaceae bacterium]
MEAARHLDDDELDAVFAALADRTRRTILLRLAEGGDATVTELVAPFELSQPAISKHLKVLANAGLISRSRDAQRRPCHLEVVRLKEVSEWLSTYREFWEASYERLDQLLAELQGTEEES